MKDSRFQMFSLVCLVFAVRCSGQCPIRPYDDPPGWAVEHSGRSRIEAKTLSPDGQWIAFSTTDGVVWMLDVNSGEKITLLPCDETSIQTFAFSPDSSLLAFGDGNGIIRLYDVRTRTQIKELHDPEWVLILQFDGPKYLLAEGNYGLSIWDLTSSKRLALIPEFRCESPTSCSREIYDHFALSPSKKVVALAGRYISGIVVRNLSGEVSARIPALDETTSFTFRPGRASNLFIADEQGDIASWEATTGKLLSKFPAHLHRYVRLAFLPGSDTRLLAFDAASAQVWDVERAKLLETWKPVIDGHFLSPDGGWMSYAETERVDVPHILGDDALKNLRYKTSTQIVAPWRVEDRALVARLLNKEPSFLALFILFVGLGLTGYLLCRFRWWMVAPFVAFLALYLVWWLRELHWPRAGPRLAPYAGTAFVAGSYALMLAAVALPIFGAVRNKRLRKAGSFSEWKWVLALVQTAICILSIWLTSVQHRVYMERLQIVADVRAGGEERGAADPPWNYSPLMGSDVVSALDFPVVALFLSIASHLDSSYYPMTSLKLNLFLGFPAAILLFSFWWFLGGILDGSFRLKGEIVRRTVACLGIVAGFTVILGGLWAIHSCWRFPIMSIGAFIWGLVTLSCSSWALVRKKWSQKVPGFNV
jgi:WD40 repeat protein